MTKQETSPADTNDEPVKDAASEAAAKRDKEHDRNYRDDAGMN